MQNRILSTPHYIIICGLSGYTLFFHLISLTAQCSKNEVIEHEMYVLIFSTNFVWNSFRYKKNIDLLSHYHSAIYIYIYIYIYMGFRVKFTLLLSYFHETSIFSTDCRNIIEYQTSWKSVHREPNCSMRADGRNDYSIVSVLLLELHNTLNVLHWLITTCFGHALRPSSDITTQFHKSEVYSGRGLSFTNSSRAFYSYCSK